MSELKPYKTDVAVLILFFNRPSMLEKVFAQVKEARPSRLYLFQDGARSGREDDAENVMKCRDIVSDIDWDCEVHQNYQAKNNGCDPSEYLAQKWMFANEEMGIVLEDDDVPSQSFFPFCKELLEKYKDDQRINMICGMNNTGISEDCPYDYLFSTTGSIWGWASWKRVIDEWTDYVPFVEDEYWSKLFVNRFSGEIDAQTQIEHYKNNNSKGVAFYESILSANVLMNSRLNIVPKYNMISNIGFSGESTHGAPSLNTLPKGIRRIFNMKTYDYEFPLKHPDYVIEDVDFRKKLFRIMAKGHPVIQKYRNIESVILRLRYGEGSSVIKGIKRRLGLKK